MAPLFPVFAALLDLIAGKLAANHNRPRILG